MLSQPRGPPGRNRGSPPAGWFNIDNAGSGVVWAFDDPPGRVNDTGGAGPFAIADSDLAGDLAVDTALVTPAIDLTGTTSAMLRFQSSFRRFSSEVADVDVSDDGGANWTNLWRQTGATLIGETVQISLDAYAGQPGLRVRFHYYNARFEWWWKIDNVWLGVDDEIFSDGFEG